MSIAGCPTSHSLGRLQGLSAWFPERKMMPINQIGFRLSFDTKMIYYEHEKYESWLPKTTKSTKKTRDTLYISRESQKVYSSIEHSEA